MLVVIDDFVRLPRVENRKGRAFLADRVKLIGERANAVAPA
jgi:hypothetical protein